MQTPAVRQRSRWALYHFAFSVLGMVLGARWGLRHPRRLTVLAIADEAPDAVFFVLRVAGPCSGAGRGSPPGQPWSSPDR